MEKKLIMSISDSMLNIFLNNRSLKRDPQLKFVSVLVHMKELNWDTSMLEQKGV